ncbi:TetR family transcriptional regulator [Flavimobilis soli]|uniref:TetR family transcriptional regulator n=1 Tax=Flavimobilis soli TaxID=442709 RepID=A0A2A9EBQ8_9MICO|nr:TetR family transcriptional regulator [Flavimobilis soli]PFG36497.1 TetR family transcriptional regulator [Flavimobilis soli]
MLTPNPTATDASDAPRRRARGEARREALVAAAAAIIREEGPGALTHRALALRAGVPLAATTYYFSSLEEILEVGGAVLAESWATNIREVLDDTEAVAAATTGIRRAELITRALLPEGDDAVVRHHYEHLVGAGRTPALARSYASGRHRFDAAITEMLRALDVDEPPALVLAVVDGGAVAALSEGRPVRPYVAALLVRLFAR